MGEYIPTEQELVTELCKARECDWERFAEELELQEKIHSEFGTIATSGYREYLRSYKENFIKIPQEYMLPSAEWRDMALSDILDEVCNAPKEYQRIIFAMINRYRRAARELLTGRAREDFIVYDENFFEAKILEKELKKEGVRVFTDHDDIEQWAAELKKDRRIPLTIDKNLKFGKFDRKVMKQVIDKLKANGGSMKRRDLQNDLRWNNKKFSEVLQSGIDSRLWILADKKEPSGQTSNIVYVRDDALTEGWKAKERLERIRAKKWLREWKKQEVQNAEKYSELKKRWESLANDKRSITSDDIPEDDSRCVTFCDEFLFESELVKKVIVLQELQALISERMEPGVMNSPNEEPTGEKNEGSVVDEKCGGLHAEARCLKFIEKCHKAETLENIRFYKPAKGGRKPKGIKSQKNYVSELYQQFKKESSVWVELSVFEQAFKTYKRSLTEKKE